MCLIIVKPLGTPMIEDILLVAKASSVSNNDGFGFVLKRNGSKPSTLFLDKGYMEIDNMINTIKSLKVTSDDELMIHLRMATHGKVMPVNTHPFIVTDNDEELNTLKGAVNKPIVAHNGWFNITCKGEYSDTWTWVKNTFSKSDVFDPIVNEGLDFDAAVVKKHVGYSNKIAVMFPDRDIQLIGNGWVENDGVFYSNSGFKYHLKSNTKQEQDDSYGYYCGYGN